MKLSSLAAAQFKAQAFAVWTRTHPRSGVWRFHSAFTEREEALAEERALTYMYFTRVTKEGYETDPRRYRGSRARRDPARSALKWHTSAGGTGAHHGRTYSARGAFGEYHIWPPSTRFGSYSLQWANTTGRRAAHGGLWHDLGRFRSPNAAKKAAREHEMTTRLDPRRRTAGKMRRR
jgi:hypothetical protein